MARLLLLGEQDRPRERLLRLGAHRLEPDELLALVLGTGRGSGEDALELAARVLDEVGGLEALAAADGARLLGVLGIGPVKAARIRAAFELCLRAGPVEPAGARSAHGGDGAGDDGRAGGAPHALARLRGQLPPGATALLAWRPGLEAPITLALGAGLDGRSRLGALVAQLLAVGVGPWQVAALRPGGPPTAVERRAARRLMEAAARVEVPIAGIVLLHGADVTWLAGRTTSDGAAAGALAVEAAAGLGHRVEVRQARGGTRR